MPKIKIIIRIVKTAGFMVLLIGVGLLAYSILGSNNLNPIQAIQWLIEK